MSAENPTYCPICGETLVQREAGGRERPVCDNCGYVHYLNPIPGVGIIIETPANDDQNGIVLIQRGHPPHKDLWSLPSGFVEADESAEEAAIREAEEETGLKVEVIEMMGVNSFPEGPPVSGIMIFYRARPVGGTLRAGDDAASAKVFPVDAMPLLPFRTHREIMAEWLERFHTPNTEDSITSDEGRTQLTFDIRPAQPDDIEEIIALLAMIPANRTLTDNEWMQVAQRIRESVLVEVFVAQTRQEPCIIIGCVALSVVRTLTEGRGFINDMAVLPTYQRRGVGAELLEAVLRRASQLNLTSMMVNTQRANDQARAFYAAVGFREEQVLHLRIRG